jgi:hypothetical protein
VSFRRAVTGIFAVLALSGCGADEEVATVSGPSTTTAETAAEDGAEPRASPACRAVPRAKVERAVARAAAPRAPLDRSANDSLDLSICEYRERQGRDLFVSVTLDTAPKTARRYYNLIAEALQRATFAHVPDSTEPVGVRGVGNDRTHGGVGAYWTPYTSQLTAIDAETLVKVKFYVPGADDRSSKIAAAGLAAVALDSRRG